MNKTEAAEHNLKHCLEDLREAVKADLIKDGWNPPQTWQPKEGELVQIKHLDGWISVSYTEKLHPLRDCRPHPTHIRWENGEVPEAGKYVGSIYLHHSGRRFAQTGEKRDQWFWLDES